MDVVVEEVCLVVAEEALTLAAAARADRGVVGVAVAVEEQAAKGKFRH